MISTYWLMLIYPLVGLLVLGAIHRDSTVDSLQEVLFAIMLWPVFLLFCWYEEGWTEKLLDWAFVAKKEEAE